MKKKKIQDEKVAKVQNKGKATENKNVLDSRKNEEFEVNRDKVTHNRKETTKNK